MRKTETKTLINAMRILACKIQSPDDVPNAAIRETADRLDELSGDNRELSAAMLDLLRINRRLIDSDFADADARRLLDERTRALEVS